MCVCAATRDFFARLGTSSIFIARAVVVVAVVVVVWRRAPPSIRFDARADRVDSRRARRRRRPRRAVRG